jgi:hypothetical protein
MASVNSGNSTEKATGAAKPRTEFNLQKALYQDRRSCVAAVTMISSETTRGTAQWTV